MMYCLVHMHFDDAELDVGLILMMLPLVNDLMLFLFLLA